MKITIDTKEDSHEEIKKIIHMLSSLIGAKTNVGSENASKSIFEQDSPLKENVLGNIFAESEKKESSGAQEVKAEEEKEDDYKIQIVEY